MFRGLSRLIPGVIGLVSVNIFLPKQKTCRMMASRVDMISHNILYFESDSRITEQIQMFGDIETDMLLLFGVSKLHEKTREDIWDAIETIRKEYPAINVIFMLDREEFPIALGDDKNKGATLGVIRSAGDPMLRRFDLSTLLFDKQFIAKALTPVQSLKNMDRIKTFSKFELLIATCQADKSKKAFLKHLSFEETFDAPQMSYYDFESCQKLSGGPDDLFLIKKHSNLNSPSHVSPVEIDGVQIDLTRLSGFFSSISGKVHKQTVSESAGNDWACNWRTRIARAFVDMSIFTPTNFADTATKNYSMWININLNRISQRQKKMILQNAVEAIDNLPAEMKGQIQVIFNPTNVYPGPYEITMTNDYAIRQRSIYQMARTKAEKERINAEFPFDLLDRRNSYTYKFEPQLINWEADALVRFIHETCQHNIVPYYQSQRSRPSHYSNKLVLETFTDTHFDGKDHVILFYSGIGADEFNLIRSYEDAFKQELAKKKYPQLRWHHMNATKNTTVLKTPIVAYFKKGQMLPFTLQDSEATAEKVRQFIDATYHLEIDYDLYRI